MREPLISIVTPSYNQAQYLGATIDSIIQQDYPEIEYLVFDGGSNDGSVDIIRERESAIDFWVSQKDNGQASAINSGWRRSNGEILAWLNSDDTYEPGAISAIVDAFNNDPQTDVITADCQVINERGNVMKSLPSGAFSIHFILAGNSLPQQGVFCRRHALERAGWLNPHLNYVFDWALWLNLWLTGAKFRHLEQCVANFRIWAHSKTANQTIGASLSGGLPFALERLSVLEGSMQAERQSGSHSHFELLHNAWCNNLVEVAMLYYLEEDLVQSASYSRAYFKHKRPGVPSLRYPQALAAHLAYLEGNIRDTVKAFIEFFFGNTPDNGCDNHTNGGLTRILLAETYIVRAWNASHYQDNKAAAYYFGKALHTNPRLLSERRVLSPALKFLARTFTAGKFP